MGRLVTRVFPDDGVVPESAPGASGVESDGNPFFARLLAAYKESDAGRYEFLLLLRFAIVNLFGFALLAGAWLEGWVAIVLAADSTNLSLAIFVVFLGGLAVCGKKIVQTSHEINLVKRIRRSTNSKVAQYLKEIEGRDADSRAIVASVLRLKLFSRIGIVRYTAGSLVVLGLIGTVVGFIIALSGVHPDSATDPSSISPMVATLIAGMSVALYTTLVGAVLNIWLMTNYHILATGTIKLTTALVELGERHVRN